MSRCGTCNVALEAGVTLQVHYSSEVHLHNVRRRVEGLRPLTMQEMRASGIRCSEVEERNEDGQPAFSCTLCKKTFRSVQTLQAHVRSTAHLIMKEQRIISRDSEAATMLTSTSIGSAAMGLHRRHNAKRSAVKGKQTVKDKPRVSYDDREEDADETRCIFCGFPSVTVEANLVHLLKVHDFTIPMETHCNNVPGLLAYLARKVSGLMCIVCNENTKSYASLCALRDHMHEKQHEKIVLAPEYQEFYDCALEGPEASTAVVLERVHGDELVLLGQGRGEKKRVALRREGEVPRHRSRETEQQTEARRTIVAAEQQALAVAQQEQRQLTKERNKEQAKRLKRSEGVYQTHQLKVNLRSNKLHPKGYDGEGLVN